MVTSLDELRCVSSAGCPDLDLFAAGRVRRRVFEGQVQLECYGMAVVLGVHVFY